LGDSFAGGTTDGAGQPPFEQGINYTVKSGLLYTLNSLAHVLSEPGPAQRACHHPKPILFNVGEIDLPFRNPWCATIIPLQIFRVGQLFIVGVPGEFTTMSGRRLRSQVRSTLIASGVSAQGLQVVIGGLSSEYIHYIATPEEYQVQRYEAASTLYGPETLPAFLEQFSIIARSIASNTTLPASVPPPYTNFTGKIFPIWSHDTHPFNKPFGTVLSQVSSSYSVGQTVSVMFQGASPDNDYRTGSTFLQVQVLTASKTWQTVLTDADFETIFRWKQPDELLHDSIVTLEWTIQPAVSTGTYRLVYLGNSKAEDGTLTPFTGTSSSFTVSSNTSRFSSLSEWRSFIASPYRPYVV